MGDTHFFGSWKSDTGQTNSHMAEGELREGIKMGGKACNQKQKKEGTLYFLRISGMWANLWISVVPLFQVLQGKAQHIFLKGKMVLAISMAEENLAFQVGPLGQVDPVHLQHYSLPRYLTQDLGSCVLKGPWMLLWHLNLWRGNSKIIRNQSPLAHLATLACGKNEDTKRPTGISGFEMPGYKISVFGVSGL